MTADGASPRMIGRRLGAARQLRGIMREAAAHLGLNLSSLIALEAGDRAATAAEIVQLAALYGRPVHWFTWASGSAADIGPDPSGSVEEVDPDRVAGGIDDRPEPSLPRRHQILALQAYGRGELTEKELANSLGCDVWEARQLVRESGQGGASTRRVGIDPWASTAPFRSSGARPERREGIVADGRDPRCVWDPQPLCQRPIRRDPAGLGA